MKRRRASTRVPGALGCFFIFLAFFVFFGVTVDDGLARGALQSVVRCVGLVSFFWGVIFSFLFLVFISGQTANRIVGISYDRNFVSFVNVCVVI